MAERAISKLIPTLWGPDLQECRIYEDGLDIPKKIIVTIGIV